MKMSGNTILVTGATSGIGRAFAQRFAALGNTVIACGRRKERLDELSEESRSIVTRPCDVTNAQERKELIAWAYRNHPALNVLINNAGIQLAVDLTRPLDMENVELEINTNLIAPIHLGSLFIDGRSGRGPAAIVNISSGLAFTPIAVMPVYCATKAAIHSFTMSLRRQLSESEIQVFEIAPPGVDTELGHQHRSDKSRSHGGMPIAEFMDAAMRALEDDSLETAVGPAAGMHEMRDRLFDQINGRR